MRRAEDAAGQRKEALRKIKSLEMFIGIVFNCTETENAVVAACVVVAAAAAGAAAMALINIKQSDNLVGTAEYSTGVLDLERVLDLLSGIHSRSFGWHRVGTLESLAQTSYPKPYTLNLLP